MGTWCTRIRGKFNAIKIQVYETKMLAGHPPFYDDDPAKLYEKILACKPKFPTHFDPLAKDLVKKLLTPDLTKRFGNLKAGASGISHYILFLISIHFWIDIQHHKWFAPIDWDKLKTGQIAAPYIPPNNGEGVNYAWMLK